MAGIGFTAVNIPETYGGAGLDAVCMVLVISELVKQCAGAAKTKAVAGGDDYVINGSKCFIFNKAEG